jgi:chloramphenicol O-acetyltransferase type B
MTFFFTLIARRTVKAMGMNCRVNFFCRFTKKTVIGDNCHFNGLEVSGNGNVTIGSHFHSGKECLIFTSYHNYDGGETLPYDQTYIDKNVTIEDNVWIGTRVIILGGVTLGEGCIIQAGSVVVQSIPSCAVAGGSPAKVFKMRNMKHYEKLKADGKFIK